MVCGRRGGADRTPPALEFGETVTEVTKWMPCCLPFFMHLSIHGKLICIQSCQTEQNGGVHAA